jgi:putative peptidoglycan lipid II flippase
MNLFRALLTVSGFTLLSRVTGLIRETLIARAFGASQFTDAFYVAFRIPNLLRRLSAEGAFSQAFVPILAEFKNTEGHDAPRPSSMPCPPCSRGRWQWYRSQA